MKTNYAIFRDALRDYALDAITAENAVQLRRQYRMKLPDAIIWGTAKAHHAVLVTRNTKDFNPEWEDIDIPYKL